MAGGGLLFAMGAPEVGAYFWICAGLFLMISLWCGFFSVVVTVSDGVLRISAGGIRVMRAAVVDIDRVAPIVDMKNDWGMRHLFGLYTVFDGRTQAVAGLPLAQVNSGKKSVVASIQNCERLIQVVQKGGAELDGKEAGGVRSYNI